MLDTRTSDTVVPKLKAENKRLAALHVIALHLGMSLALAKALQQTHHPLPSIETQQQLDATRRELIDARSEAAAAGVASGELPGKVQRLEAEVRRRVRLCDRLFLTRRSVSTLDRVSFQLTDERTLFVLLARPSGS